MAGLEQGLVFFDQLLTDKDLGPKSVDSHNVNGDDKLDNDASMFSTNTVNSVSEHDIEEDIMSRPDDDNALHAPEGDFENTTFAGDTSPKMSPSVLDPDDDNISSLLRYVHFGHNTGQHYELRLTLCCGGNLTSQGYYSKSGRKPDQKQIGVPTSVSMYARTFCRI